MNTASAGVHPEPISCPCGSGADFARCCKPLIDGRQVARSALDLMRSRYSAFVVGDHEYILITWAQEFRPKNLDLNTTTVRWLGLTIHQCDRGEEGDSTGMVEFSAAYSVAGSWYTLHEKSRFVKLSGKWYYQDGISKTSRNAVGRNALCPCGSRKKFKNCCGSGQSGRRQST